jgi:hypothetical protein
MRLAILSPDKSVAYSFYDNLTSLAKAAASSLGHELEVLTLTDLADRDGWAGQLIAQGRSLLSRVDRPRYLILPNYMGIAEHLTPPLSAAGIEAFIVAERARSGLPGVVGQIVPDDVEAGAMLGRGLLSRARAALGDRVLEAAILAGDHTSAGASRFLGWHNAAREDGRVHVVGFQYAVWRTSYARDQTIRFLREHPSLSLIWAASDAMAVGACEAAKAEGRRPGVDFFVGGIDFDRAGLARVRDGEQSLSIGGHILDGARAVVALHERDLGRRLAPEALESPWLEVDATNAGAYLDFVSQRRWKGMDFRRFTTDGGGRLEDLSLEALVNGP